MAKLHSICVIPDRVQRFSTADTELTNLLHDWPQLDENPPAQDGHDHREPNSPFADITDEELVRELLLDREVGVHPEPAGDPVEKVLVAIVTVVDLYVRVAWRAVPENRPVNGWKASWASGKSQRHDVPFP